MTSLLGTEKWLTFFYSVLANIHKTLQYIQYCLEEPRLAYRHLGDRVSKFLNFPAVLVTVIHFMYM